MNQVPNKFGFYQCPCCGYYTFGEPLDNTFNICRVCFWEDDGVQLHDPTYSGGANTVSLNEAKANYSEYGASERRFKPNVRKALPDELPD